jgi:uncharacterized protein (TIGR03435 family)
VKLLLTFALTISALSAQTFEVASVRRSPPSADGAAKSTGMILRRPGEPVNPDRITWNSVSLKSVVLVAYGLSPDQISGPDWIDDERYDINAKLPAGATQDQLPAMVQNLLAERFHLVARVENRPRLQYVLVVGKSGPKLQPANDTGNPGFTTSVDGIRLKNSTVAAFAGLLSSFMQRQVKDETAIQGHFDITLNIPKEDLARMRADNNLTSSIISAVQDLGLKIESRTEPAKFVVVEKADRIPTEN